MARSAPVRPATVPANSGRSNEGDPDWPDLPPLFQLRTGIARESIGRGLDYCLPVDKCRLSVGNDFRSDLRAMFQTPYLQAARMFDSGRLHAVNRHHLRPNTAHSPSRKEVTQLIDSFALRTGDDVQLRQTSASLAAAPKEAVESYCNTSPDNRPLFTPERMRTRSKLFVPFKRASEPSPASIEARAKAESILKELNIGPGVLKDTCEGNGEERARKEEENAEGRRKEGKRRREESKQRLSRLKNAGIRSYEETKRDGATFRLKMPKEARSPFLDDEANSKIWDWLTETAVMSEFEYFMVLCK